MLSGTLSGWCAVRSPAARSFELPRNNDLTFMVASERQRYSVKKSKAEVSTFNPAAFQPPLPIASVPSAAPFVHHAPVLSSLSAQGVSPQERAIVSMSRDELIGLLPEGLAGESARDLILQPVHQTACLHHIVRRQTAEICAEIVALSTLPRMNCNILLDGKRGTGKSSILNFLVGFVRQLPVSQPWLVLYEPHPSRYLREVSEIRRCSSGLYLQPELASGFLQRVLQSNGPLLAELPVNSAIYGRSALDGATLMDSMKRGFSPLAERIVDSRPGDTTRLERVHAVLATELQMGSIVDVLPQPRNVREIAETGIQHEEYAQQAVWEVMRQIQNQDKFPCLLAVDEFNETLPVSDYVSVRYDNTRFNGHIPGYHLAMARVFARPWRLKRGLNLFATSWRARSRRDFRAELCGFQSEDVRTVKEFSLSEFRLFATSLVSRGILDPSVVRNVDYWFMASQGNAWQARKLLTTLF